MKKMVNSKRGVFDQLAALGVGIATLAITLVVVFLILSQVAANGEVSADQNATAAVDELQGAADDIPGWVPLVVIVAIGGLILAMVRIFR